MGLMPFRGEATLYLGKRADGTDHWLKHDVHALADDGDGTVWPVICTGQHGGQLEAWRGGYRDLCLTVTPTPAQPGWYALLRHEAEERLPVVAWSLDGAWGSDAWALNVEGSPCATLIGAWLRQEKRTRDLVGYFHREHAPEPEPEPTEDEPGNGTTVPAELNIPMVGDRR